MIYNRFELLLFRTVQLPYVTLPRITPLSLPILLHLSTQCQRHRLPSTEHLCNRRIGRDASYLGQGCTVRGLETPFVIVLSISCDLCLVYDFCVVLDMVTDIDWVSSSGSKAHVLSRAAPSTSRWPRHIDDDMWIGYRYLVGYKWESRPHKYKLNYLSTVQILLYMFRIILIFFRIEALLCSWGYIIYFPLNDIIYECPFTPQ